MVASHDLEFDMFWIANHTQQISGDFLGKDYAISVAEYNKYLAVEELALMS